ncbi:stellacyanin-like [Cynara cardunculus var. scolymus]|nr:stellacyanin-like [Cynara cardunculus var. scolymus]
MASSTSFALLFLAIATATTTAAAKEFQVGDAVGWRIPATNETELYNVWASRRRFHIGDSLRFHYKTDSVVVVEKWGFYHCDSSNPLSFFNDGNTLINLDKVGTIYFISGNADRCNKGQRMTVKVMNLHQFPPSIAPSIAIPPQNNPYYAMSPSPSPSHLSGSGTSSDSGPVASVSASIMVLIVGLGLWLVQP